MPRPFTHDTGLSTVECNGIPHKIATFSAMTALSSPRCHEIVFDLTHIMTFLCRALLANQGHVLQTYLYVQCIAKNDDSQTVVTVKHLQEIICEEWSARAYDLGWQLRG
jgi:hypothetical protein